MYAAARCWLSGLDPYAVGDLVISGRAAGVMLDGAPITDAFFLATPSVYLPPAFPLIAPFAALPWVVAKPLWLCTSLLATAYMARVIVRSVPRFPLAGWAFLLAFAPLHTALGKGQPSIVVCALLAGSLASCRSPWLGGVLLGAATCLKPQLACEFVLLAFLVGQWRKFGAAVMTGVGLCGLALLVMKAGALDTLLETLATVTAPTGVISGSPLNPLSYQLISLDTVIPMLPHRGVVLDLVYAGVLLVTTIAVLRARDPWMKVAVVAAAVPLIGYHRFYDAQILWLAIPALVLVGKSRGAPLLLLGFGVFLVPAQTLAHRVLGAYSSHPLAWIPLHVETLACFLLWVLLMMLATDRRRWLETGKATEACSVKPYAG